MPPGLIISDAEIDHRHHPASVKVMPALTAASALTSSAGSLGGVISATRWSQNSKRKASMGTARSSSAVGNLSKLGPAGSSSRMAQNRPTWPGEEATPWLWS